MTSLFSKPILPMLLKTASKPFDDKNYIFELKLDGIRAVVFCQKNGTRLQNRKLKEISHVYPELLNIHKQCKQNCILDGEIIYVDEKGFPNFQVLQKRNLLTGKQKIEKVVQKYPVCFVAFDILAIGNKDITNLVLQKRKKILLENIKENEYISVARYINENGIAFFNKIKELSLEGIVAKNLNSTYNVGQRTEKWQKIKNIQSEDYIVCGYTKDETGDVKNLILAKKTEDKLAFDGEIYVPSSEAKKFVFDYAKKHKSTVIFDFLAPNIVWMTPNLICRVDFAARTDKGERRQPVFRGIRTDW